MLNADREFMTTWGKVRSKYTNRN